MHDENNIRTKDQFEILMREIDADLQNKGVPIPLRQLEAVGEVSKRLKITLPFAPLLGGPLPNIYTGESMSAHIVEWFNNRYGDRLKIDFAIGYSVILLRGDAWLLRFPQIYGIVTVICERDLSKQFPKMVVNRAGQPHQKAFMNLLKLIEKLPQGLANQLTDDELKALLNYFSFGHKFFNAVASYCKGEELAVTAIEDLSASAKVAFGKAYNHGQSLWLSLQAAEKILKYFIASKGEKYQQTHDLSKLSGQAYALGLPIIDEDLINRVQCKAGIRYEQKKYSIQKVVEAHQGALQIASVVTESMFSISKSEAGLVESLIKPAQAKDAPTSFDTILKPGHFYHNPTLGFSYYCHDITDGVANIILVESYQHGHLFQTVFKQKVEYQGSYVEITDPEEIDRLKKVGDKIFRDHGVT